MRITWGLPLRSEATINTHQYLAVLQRHFIRLTDVTLLLHLVNDGTFERAGPGPDIQTETCQAVRISGLIFGRYSDAIFVQLIYWYYYNTPGLICPPSFHC